jgi:hypothetical protein
MAPTPAHSIIGAGSIGNTWAIAASNPHSGVQHMHANDPTTVSDQRLVSPAVVIPTGQNPVTLKFWHKPDLETSGATACWDAGILEVSTNGGGTWTQVPNANLLVGPYRGPINTGANPLGGLQGWCGATAYMNTIADISSYAGTTAQFRFRLGSDSSVGDTGWDLDDVAVQSCEVPCVYDVNGSGAVDIIDVQLVASAFGTNVPAYDFNNNGIVDVLDIQVVAEHWQVGC